MSMARCPGCKGVFGFVSFLRGIGLTHWGGARSHPPGVGDGKPDMYHQSYGDRWVLLKNRGYCEEFWGRQGQLSSGNKRQMQKQIGRSGRRVKGGAPSIRGAEEECGVNVAGESSSRRFVIMAHNPKPALARAGGVCRTGDWGYDG